MTVVNAADARELPPELTGFDRVLVDAPCSGLGVLASRPDLRWRAKPLPELSSSSSTSPLSACVREARSHTRSARSRLRRTRTSSTPAALRSSPSTATIRTRAAGEFRLTMPHKHGTSGFFIARIRP